MTNPELHFSDLKHMAQSPAHYRAGLETGFVATRSMNKGTLLHSIVLGGEYVVYPGERRGNAWKDFEAANEGKFIVTQKEYDVGHFAADAVLADRVAAPLLVGRHEHGWRTELYGRPCAGRIDVAGAGFTTDLKSTRDATPWRFQRDCLRMAYHAQLGWYGDARRAMGEDPGEHFIVGVELKPPYPVTVLRVVPRALEEGRKLVRLWLEQLRACEESDEWPSYTQSVVDLDIVEDDELIIGGEESADDAA